MSLCTLPRAATPSTGCRKIRIQGSIFFNSPSFVRLPTLAREIVYLFDRIIENNSRASLAENAEASEDTHQAHQPYQSLQTHQDPIEPHRKQGKPRQAKACHPLPPTHNTNEPLNPIKKTEE